MKRIAVVIDPWDLPFNGTVVSTRRFVAALENEFDFALLAIPGEESEGDARIVPFRQLSVPGFNAIINAMKAPLAKPDRRRLREALRDSDLLHVQFPFLLAASAISVARELGVPVICSFHVQAENVLRNVGIRSPTLARWLYKLFVAGIYNRADRIITPSAFARDLLHAHGVSRPVTVLSNGVPDMFFQLPRAPRADGRHVIVSVGRLAGEKRHDVIMDAVARSRYRDRLTLHVAGAGPKEAQLKQRAQTLGIDATVGTVSNERLMALYSMADLFVHAGEVELEGMSVLEAMASGNVVLLANSAESAASELVTDPNARFDNRDANDLAARIDRWLEDPSARETAARQNREIASGRAHAQSVTQLASIYRETLAAHGRE